jgi:hypothetical protein
VSTERDIEPILDAWMAPGPSQMPDRVYHDVLGRIERTPQRGGAWTTRRFTTMFSPFKIPAAAVVAALVMGLVALQLAHGPADVQQAPAASAEVSPDVSAGASPTPIDKPLSGRWVAPVRTVDGLTLDWGAALWGIDRWGFWANAPAHEDGGTDLGSDATTISPGRFQLVTKADYGGCPSGSVGIYDWSTSIGDTRITVEPVEEACPPRAEFLTGEWRRAGYCDIEYRDCTGNLPAGRFEPAMFAPHRVSDTEPLTQVGTFSFEVPEGWANDFDSFDGYQLTTSKGYAREAGGAATGSDALWISPRPAATLPGLDNDKDCNPTLDSSVDPSVDGLVGWLTSNPNLTVIGEPSTMTIDGHPATVVDFSVDADAAIDVPATCYDEGTPDFPLFADALAFRTSGAWNKDRWSWNAFTRAGDAWRVILFDLDGQPMLVILDSSDPADQAAWVEQAMPIVESFAFPT